MTGHRLKRDIKVRAKDQVFMATLREANIYNAALNLEKAGSDVMPTTVAEKTGIPINEVYSSISYLKYKIGVWDWVAPRNVWQHKKSKPIEACAKCGKPASLDSGAKCRRYSGKQFGIEGSICITCYQKLKKPPSTERYVKGEIDRIPEEAHELLDEEYKRRIEMVRMESLDRIRKRGAVDD